jgi:hypothetical protein
MGLMPELRTDSSWQAGEPRALALCEGSPAERSDRITAERRVGQNQRLAAATAPRPALENAIAAAVVTVATVGGTRETVAFGKAARA